MREDIRVAAASLRWSRFAIRAQQDYGTSTRRLGWRRLIPAVTIFFLAPLAGAQQTDQPPSPPRTLQTIVVTATRTPQRAFDVPASVDAIPLGAIDADHPNVNPSEALRGVPGVLARDRQNYAQDEQISIRGHGSRASFGVRGVRLYVDGIPATMPDGQGQSSNFDLAAADRIEVLRGPFSALYGNSSGGVIQVFTADGTPWPQQRLGLNAGPYGTWHADVNARGSGGPFGYNADLEHFHTSGFRRHSAARRSKGNAKLTYATHGGGKLTLLLNSVHLHALDPQGLTWAQYLADPRQAAPSALVYDTRKQVRQDQGGAVWQQPLGDHQRLRVLAYYGDRATTQFLSVPVFAETSPLSSGGVVDLATRYGGMDARWSWQADPLRLTVGVNWDREDQHRLGYDNFIDDQVGVTGALRRDEQDDVHDFDEYAQAAWNFAQKWSLTAGVRHSTVHFNTDDAFITSHNPDDGGRVGYAATTPVAGLTFHVNPDWNVYAALGRGFETPTFSELAYRADGSPGMAFDLQPARSDNAEIGSKLRWADGAGKLDVALFRSNTRDELSVFQSSGGRTTYRNIGRARRSGVEVGLDAPLAHGLGLHLAWTRLDARFTRVNPCAAACPVAPGARISGVPRDQLYAGLRWNGSGGWHAALDAFAIGAVAVDDANSAHAPGYATLGFDAGRVVHYGIMTIAPFVRIDNLFDRRYIGSVIVNDGNGRYYEPAPGRSVMVGVKVRFDERSVTR
ncbi:MAG TPA: TonB-dependent receptor [Rhodanobacteraceae bacterium]|nr:TonB-dependent receptor [Rhodanobacteraceae bacterium]